VCLKGPDHGGCGRLTGVAEPVEALLTDAVLTRLDSGHLAKVLAGKSSPDHDAAALAAQVEADQARLDELAGLYADGSISAREWIAARDPITARINQARRDIAAANRHQRGLRAGPDWWSAAQGLARSRPGAPAGHHQSHPRSRGHRPWQPRRPPSRHQPRSTAVATMNSPRHGLVRSPAVMIGPETGPCLMMSFAKVIPGADSGGRSWGFKVGSPGGDSTLTPSSTMTKGGKDRGMDKIASNDRAVRDSDRRPTNVSIRYDRYQYCCFTVLFDKTV
jgi:hypothetical protein